MDIILVLGNDIIYRLTDVVSLLDSEQEDVKESRGLDFGDYPVLTIDDLGYCYIAQTSYVQYRYPDYLFEKLD